MPLNKPIAVTITSSGGKPAVYHVDVNGMPGRAAVQPVYTKVVLDKWGPNVTAAISLDIITVLAVLAAIAMPIISQALERKHKRALLDAEHAGARVQLTSILQELERFAAALEAMPRVPLRNAVDMLQPFVERALAADMAAALSPTQKTAVYRALALLQTQIALATAYQADIDKGIEQLEAERVSALATARSLHRLQNALNAAGQRNNVFDLSECERLRLEAERLQTEIQELVASREFVAMEEFNETQEQRRAEIQNRIPIIEGNAASMRHHLQDARAALGDRTEVAAPVRERPLAAPTQGP